MNGAWLILGVLLLAASGCEARSEMGPRDSVSVHTLLPVALLGGEIGPVLGQPGDLVTFADGTVAVADNGAQHILHLDLDGRVLATWGRGGRGPGEFQRVSRLWGFGRDSLLAYDPNSRRITIIDKEVGIVAQYMVEAPPGHTGYVDPLGATAAGYVLGGGQPIIPSDPPVMDRGPRTLFVVRSDSLQAVLAGYRDIEAFRGSGRQVLSLPLGRNTLFFSTADRVYSLDTAEDTVRVRALSGEPIEVVGLGIPPRALTDEHVRIDRLYRIAELQQMFAGQGAPVQYVEGRKQALEAVPYPPTWPTASDLLVDENGRLWLRRDITPALGDHQLWDVYSRDGRVLARFRVDGVTGRISVPRDGHFWAVKNDAAGAPQLARFSIVALSLP